MSDYEAVCLHEATHAVIALKVVSRSLSVTVTIREDGGQCRRDGGPQLSWAEHVVWVASGGIVDRWLDHSWMDDSTDRQRLAEAKQHFESPAVFERLLKMTERAVLAHVEEILSLAKYMEQRSPGVFHWGESIQ